jgi:hypothetical protein
MSILSDPDVSGNGSPEHESKHGEKPKKRRTGPRSNPEPPADAKKKASGNTDLVTPELAVEPAGKNQKITVKVDGQVVFVDTVNVPNAKSRAKFVKDVKEKCPGIDGEGLEAELLRLAAAPATAAPPADPPGGEPDPLAGTPRDVIDEATALLDDPELIERICDDIALVGVAGERELAGSIYLIGVSRLLTRPLAGIIRGSSASGKSFVVERVSSLFPAEAVIHATQMTPQALFHMKPGGLVHKWVVAGERSRVEDDATAEATRALREMLSGGRLSKLMPMKGDGGLIETVVINQEGPIAFTETTTLTDIFEEDLNRALLLQTDESPAQTQRVIAACASRTSNPVAADRVVQVHQALQRMLPRADVRIPWADRLGEVFPSDQVEIRRAFPQVLALVKASALLHHRQRDRDEDGTIVADVRDYQLARRLAVKPFSQALGGGVSDAAVAFLARLPKEDFAVNGIAKTLKVSKSAARGWLSELLAAEAVEVVEEGRGRKPAKWRVTGKPIDPGRNLLPAVEQVFPDLADRMSATQNDPE